MQALMLLCFADCKILMIHVPTIWIVCVCVWCTVYVCIYIRIQLYSHQSIIIITHSYIIWCTWGAKITPIFNRHPGSRGYKHRQTLCVHLDRLFLNMQKHIQSQYHKGSQKYTFIHIIKPVCILLGKADLLFLF